MRTSRPSLLRTLIRSLLVPGLIVILGGVFLVYSLVKEEYDELQDLALTSEAHLLLQIFDRRTPTADFTTLMDFEEATHEPEERSSFWFLDASGTIIAQSRNADPTLTPLKAPQGMSTADSHRFVRLPGAADGGPGVIVARPLIERNEAILDVLTGVVFGFILLGLIFTAAVYLTVRRSVVDIAALSRNIAGKNENDLSPIDRSTAFAEIVPAIDTLDKLMARLDAALSAERAFATNAAHELRTPLAVSLAHVQRLKTMVQDPAQVEGATEIEKGLKRLIRLIERLLQVSRAQSGLGLQHRATDLTPVIALLLREFRERAQPDRDIVMRPPGGPWLSHVDPDALGIILGNLFENALKYATGADPIHVDAGTPGVVRISNDCAALAPSDLNRITRRFMRNAPMSDGFGLGLSIVQSLCDQSGCSVEVHSPRPDDTRGFMAVLTLPKVDGDRAREGQNTVAEA